MASQPSYKPLTRSDFFSDGRAARPLPPHTIARGYLRTDAPLFTGRKELPPEPAIDANSSKPVDNNQTNSADGNDKNDNRQGDNNTEADKSNKQGFENNDDFVDEFPIPIDEQTIEHGYHRFMIYCVVCHDPLGHGRGKIVERGYTAPPSYHIDRLREAPVGRLFAVVSEGYGSMPSYGEQIPPRDRWAIVAYVRALQLSQHFPENQLTDAMREKLASQEATTRPNTNRAEQGGPP